MSFFLIVWPGYIITMLVLSFFICAMQNVLNFFGFIIIFNTVTQSALSVQFKLILSQV